MRMKPLLIWLAIANSDSPYPSPEIPNRRAKILDLTENGKRQQGGRCSPPIISKVIRLSGEVNKDCEYFGKFFFV